jgi:cytochrome c2
VELGSSADCRRGQLAYPHGEKKMNVRGGLRALVVAMLAATAFDGAQAGDAANGEKVFAPCKSCHQIGETAKNSVGPVVIGRKAAS